jgi:hypothetical protein
MMKPRRRAHDVQSRITRRTDLRDQPESGRQCVSDLINYRFSNNSRTRRIYSQNVSPCFQRRCLLSGKN